MLSRSKCPDWMSDTAFEQKKKESFTCKTAQKYKKAQFFVKTTLTLTGSFMNHEGQFLKSSTYFEDFFAKIENTKST